ncbi:MAG: type II toxin-antitoxin system RelE/ParE family toxin [Lachnospiraceae bacterium]|nr:type II toxin-antitoxin system RelE/ParE family toxin [Lachnospiraceae bacterium]
MRIKYSPDAKKRLSQIKRDAGNKVVGIIMKRIRDLSVNPRQCPTVKGMLGIESPYYFLHVEHNCVFYRIDNDIVYVTDIYHEREDFMGKMFGIKLRTKDSMDYWGE